MWRRKQALVPASVTGYLQFICLFIYTVIYIYALKYVSISCARTDDNRIGASLTKTKKDAASPMAATDENRMLLP